MGSDEVVAQAIAQGLAESHRTLQQNTMRSLKRAMVEYAKTRTDLRNEKAVELAKAIAELEIHLPLV
jgi:predicted HAD superfamily Cof-like phosphohydrolase